jgi:hypothetical protein
MSGQTTRVLPTSGLAVFLSRSQLFAGLYLVGFINGLAERATKTVLSDGWVAALTGTLDVSAVVWVACAVGIALLLRDSPDPPVRPDWAVVAAAGALVLVPISDLSWAALSGTALYVIQTSPSRSLCGRASWIFLAITAPMCWSPRLFSVFTEWILQVDAAAVSLLLGTERVGNAIALADGSGQMYIAASCSSLANISLAVLCWVVCAQSSERQWRGGEVSWCLLACAAVMVVNITRMSLIGRYPQHYELLHGPVGATVANWLTLALMVGICVWGVRRDLFARP